MNFYGKIISAQYQPQLESIEELKQKLSFREQEYLNFIEEKKSKIFVPKHDKKDSEISQPALHKRIMKKSYWCPPSHRNMINYGDFFQTNVKHSRKKRIDLKK